MQENSVSSQAVSRRQKFLWGTLVVLLSLAVNIGLMIWPNANGASFAGFFIFIAHIFILILSIVIIASAVAKSHDMPTLKKVLITLIPIVIAIPAILFFVFGI